MLDGIPQHTGEDTPLCTCLVVITSHSELHNEFLKAL